MAAITIVYKKFLSLKLNLTSANAASPASAITPIVTQVDINMLLTYAWNISSLSNALL